MHPIHVLHLFQTPILNQLQIEEALLRTDARNWCLINHGSSPAIVMGISGQMDELIDAEKIKKKPVPVIRRFSGGGTVFIDENTVFITFICNSKSVSTQPYPKHIMKWTETIYQPLFHPHPFRLEENDYVLNELKFGGNAQSICKERWLHHSSLLWDYKVENMDYLLIPKKAPGYRLGRGHTDFLCRLKGLWQDKNLFIDLFLKELGNHFSLQHANENELRELLERPHRRATSILNF